MRWLRKRYNMDMEELLNRSFNSQDYVTDKEMFFNQGREMLFKLDSFPSIKHYSFKDVDKVISGNSTYIISTLNTLTTSNNQFNLWCLDYISNQWKAYISLKI